jgi:integrase
MGGGSKTGVAPRGVSIQVFFMWRGQRCRETLKLEPTPKNLKYAERLREEILRKIEIGTFDYAEYFPRSSKLKKLGLSPQSKQVPTFEKLADSWMKASTHLAAGTRIKYRQALDFWKEEIGDMAITSIRYSQLNEILGKQNWKAKHRNNMFIPVRRVLDSAYLDGLIDDNPAKRIRNVKPQRPAPDPFTAEEVNTILDHFQTTADQQVYNYFTLAFFSGMRPEELIALKWQDVDFHNQTIRVERARSAGEEKDTKTSSVRDVELNRMALNAIIGQKAHTFLANEYIFHVPGENRAWPDERTQRRRYWIPALKKLGIRHRRMYQTRHTYATLNLMAGANPMWVARQLGHASMQMLLSVYSKWIDQADKSREKSKLDSAFFSTNAPQKETTSTGGR